VVCGVVRNVGEDGICERGFPVYGGVDVCVGFVYGELYVVQSVIFFYFCCEL